MAQAYFAQQQATLASNQAKGLATDIETADAQMQLVAVLDAYKKHSLEMELDNYRKFASDKMKLFTNDQKGQAERAKFEVEAAGKTVALQEQIRVSGIQSTTDQITGEQHLFELRQKHLLDSLGAQTILADATLRQQEEMYKEESSFIGAADAARRVAFEAQARRYDLDLAQLNQMLALKQISEETYAAKVTALDQDSDTKRRQIVHQFPTFFETQLQAIVSSNAFSVSQIISSWTGGVANAIVNGGDFVKAAWQSTQLAIVQGALNTGVQLAAQWALSALVEAGIVTKSVAAKLIAHTATEEAMTAVTTTQEAARVTIMTASGAAMKAAAAISVAGIASVGLAALGVMTAALEGIVGFMAAVAAAVSPVPVVGQALAGAIIVGMTLAQVAGAAAIAAATAGIAASGGAAAGTVALATGGLVMGQTVGMIGEAGPEAVIPLNSRGASFMREAFGNGAGGEGQIIHTHVSLDGRQIALATARHQPAAWRNQGAPA